MAIGVTHTYVGSIQNQRQVSDGLDSLGDSASKIWNVARWTADRIWNATGEIPDERTLKAYMKNQSCWKDLNAQSSQKVIEELSDTFQSWFDLRQTDDEANPPGYRKHGDTRPKSTVTFKADGFKHDPENNRIRLSKGSNLKENWSDFILCEYQIRPDVDLSEVNRVQNVRAVWNGDEVAGIDLGIKNIATVRTAHRKSRCGHVRNSQNVRLTSTTHSQTPSLRSVSNVVSARSRWAGLKTCASQTGARPVTRSCTRGRSIGSTSTLNTKARCVVSRC